MAELEKIWIESQPNVQKAIFIVWSNGRYHRTAIEGNKPEDVAQALFRAAKLVKSDAAEHKI